jgi:hypothetical protein
MHGFPTFLHPLWSIGLSSQFHDFTDGRTPWTRDQLLNAGQHKQNKRIHTPNIHALCGIRTQDSGFRASEDSRPLSYRDRQNTQYCNFIPYLMLVPSLGFHPSGEYGLRVFETGMLRRSRQTYLVAYFTTSVAVLCNVGFTNDIKDLE